MLVIITDCRVISGQKLVSIHSTESRNIISSVIQIICLVLDSSQGSSFMSPQSVLTILQKVDGDKKSNISTETTPTKRKGKTKEKKKKARKTNEEELIDLMFSPNKKQPPCPVTKKGHKRGFHSKGNILEICDDG